MKDLIMKKEICVGYIPGDGKAYATIELKGSEKGPVLSICGHSLNMGGQCLDSILKEVKNWSMPKEKYKRLVEIWKNWHLNDMRTGCEHQRKTWDISEKIEITYFTRSTAYHNLRGKAIEGELTFEEYTAYKDIIKKVESVTIEIQRPKYLNELTKELLEKGLICIEKKEEKNAGWVSPVEHPKGLLGKPCEICGYKYGTSWLYENIPAEIIEELKTY